MDRRTFLKAAAGAGTLTAAGGLATPAVSQRAVARTLRFVPQADLANFDPIWTTQYVVRNGSALVWDTLYGFDEKLQPRRQMVESEEVSSDGLTWIFPAAEWTQISRWRASSGEGCSGECRSVGGARHYRPDDQSHSE
jgi:peptide/nickel transport system substrate-binding protein